MRHVPHVCVVPPWNDDELAPSEAAARHLTTVLRLEGGAPVSYTDGNGTRGEGVWTGTLIVRGPERTDTRPPSLSIAVAPPRPRERQRFLVEKLAELGVSELVWLASEHGSGRAPHAEKATAWATVALEQSRGAFLMAVRGPSTWDTLDRPLAVASPAGEPGIPVDMATVAIGPEGGFTDSEIPNDAVSFALGERILRVETAAIAAATLVLLGSGPSPDPETGSIVE